MANLNVAITIAAKDQASGPLGRIRGALSGLEGAAQQGAAGLQRLSGLLTGAALGGAAALGGGLVLAARAGLGFNSQMENVSARLNAFTKDGDKTAEILEMIRQRAASTPFAFGEMADAAASLLPVSIASGKGLEELIGKAEILAASNPAEGLTGAAFALREAMSGDYTSIIERFNLSRSAINELKDQGVPALEIVSQAMTQMGLDASLVTNLGQTMTGRWSTFIDTLTNWAGMATQPLFDSMSAGLGQVNERLSAISPAIEALGTTLAAGDIQGSVMNIATALSLLGAPPGLVSFVQEFIPQAVQQWNEFTAQLQGTNAFERIGSAIDRIVVAFGGVPTPAGAANTAANEFGSVLDAIVGTVEMVASGMEGIAWGVERVNEAVQIAIGLWNQLGQIAGNMNVDALAAAFERGATALNGSVSQTAVDGWNGISGAISGAAAELSNFATQAAGISMPEYLIPHSPPPFQKGLEGITQAVVDLNRATTRGILSGDGAPGGAPAEGVAAAAAAAGGGAPTGGAAEGGAMIADWLPANHWLRKKPGYDYWRRTGRWSVADVGANARSVTGALINQPQSTRGAAAAAQPIDLAPVTQAIQSLQNAVSSQREKPVDVKVTLEVGQIAQAVSKSIAQNANGVRRMGAPGKGL